MDARISLVTIGVADVRRSRAFYAALGWSGSGGEGDAPVFIQAGPIVFALWGRADLAKDSVTGDGGGWGGITLAHNVGAPDQVDAVIEEVRMAGGKILREPAATFWGGYSALFADPDGHRWEIAHNPDWRLGSDGSTRLP